MNCCNFQSNQACKSAMSTFLPCLHCRYCPFFCRSRRQLRFSHFPGVVPGLCIAHRAGGRLQWLRAPSKAVKVCVVPGETRRPGTCGSLPLESGLGAKRPKKPQKRNVQWWLPLDPILLAGLPRGSTTVPCSCAMCGFELLSSPMRVSRNAKAHCAETKAAPAQATFKSSLGTHGTAYKKCETTAPRARPRLVHFRKLKAQDQQSVLLLVTGWTPPCAGLRLNVSPSRRIAKPSPARPVDLPFLF